MNVLLQNKKTHFNYEVLDTLEAGIELLGHEVKSLKSNRGSLDGSHIISRDGEAFVLNMLIPPYQEKNIPVDYDPRRTRRLIINKPEIRKFFERATSDGLTVVPIMVYTKDKFIKISIALVRGKRKYDKRETIKKRDTNREMSREMKVRGQFATSPSLRFGLQ